MNSNPRFYPKHLAKKYVQQWNEKVVPEVQAPVAGAEAENSVNSQQVGPPALSVVTNINGFRSATPVGNERVSSTGFKSSEDQTNSSPNSLSSTSMNASSLDCSSNTSKNSSMDSNRKILEGLPDTFILAMKQLFTLLDIENSGHVHIEDIAEHWSIDSAGAVLPPNIIPSLRKVTTPGGYLTFERFCAGLKIAILRHSAQRHRQADTDSSEGSMDNSDQSGSSAEALVSSSPLSRTNSMPNLQGLKKDIPTQGDSTKILRIPSPAPSEPEYKTNNPELIQYQGPPKPPRDPSRLSMLDLHKSHHEVVRLGSRPIAGSTSSLPAAVNNKNQGGINNANGARNDQEIFIWKAPPAPFVSRNDHSNGMPRRRTIQGGIDIDKVKKVEHLEQAKKVLSGGLSLLHKTSEWYSSQLENVESQLRSAQNIENNLDQSENQPINLSLNCNINMVQDLNLRLNHLLQIPNNNSIDQPQFDGKNQQNQYTNPGQNMSRNVQEESNNFAMQRRIERLQEQNRLLTSEISRKGNRVTGLEQDKRSLIKQLFQQTSSNSIGSNASTLR